MGVLALAPADVQGEVRRRGEGAPELLGQLRVERAACRARACRGRSRARRPGTAGPRGRGPPRSAPRRAAAAWRRSAGPRALSPRASARQPPEDDADVLHRVVGVHVQVALGVHGQVEAGVAAQLLDHVVEERQPGRDLGPPVPSSVSAASIVVSLVASVAARAGAAVDRQSVTGSPSRRGRKRSFSSGRPDGDPQAALEAVPAGAVADEDRAVEQAVPDLVGPLWLEGRNRMKLASEGQLSTGRSPRAAATRPRSSAMQRHPGLHLVRRSAGPAARPAGSGPRGGTAAPPPRRPRPRRGRPPGSPGGRRPWPRSWRRCGSRPARGGPAPRRRPQAERGPAANCP